MRKKILALPFIVLAFLLLSYSVAAAWHATVTGTYTCDAGVRLVTWHVTNSENVAGTYTYWGGAFPRPLPANHGTDTWVATVIATGPSTLEVTPSWPGSNEHPKASYTVQVTGACVPPTTTTRAATTTTTTSTTTRPTTTTSTSVPTTTPTTTVTSTTVTTTRTQCFPENDERHTTLTCPTTTLPPTTTVQVTTTVPPTTVPPTTVPPATTTPAPSTTVLTVHENLAHTGANTAPLVLLGLILFFAGLTVLVVAGNKEEPLS